MQLTSTAKSIYNLRKLQFSARLAKGTGALGAILLSLSAFQTQAQVPIVYYSFQQNTGNYNASTNQHQLNPLQTINTGQNVSVSGLSTSGIDGAADTRYAAGPTLTGAALNTSGWAAVADPGNTASEYIAIPVQTSGFSDLTIQFDAIRGTDGPQNFGVLYSTDGGTTKTLISTGHTLNTSWEAKSISLTGLNAVENQTGVIFYVYGYNVTGAGTKTMALDNLQILTKTISGGTKNLVNEGTIYQATTSATGKFTRDELIISGAGTEVTVNSPLAINKITVNSGSDLNVDGNISAMSGTAGNGVIMESGSTIKFGSTTYIDGAGEFNLKNGSSIEIASVAGITSAGATGNIQVTGTRTFNNGANYKYISGSTASTGNGLPVNLAGVLTLAMNPYSSNNVLTLTNTTTKLTGELVLTEGILNTTGNALTIVKDGTDISGGNAASFIQGPLVYEVTGAGNHDLDFEIGSGTNYRKVTLAVNHTDGNTATYTATQIEGAAPGNTFTTGGDELDRVSAVRYFTLTKAGSAVTNNEQVTLSYGTNDKVNQPSTLRIANYDGANWTSMGGTGSGVTGTITSSLPLSTFGSFALGNAKGGTNPLPVELASFTATKKGSDVIIDWSTASEKDNKGFNVQVSNNSNDFRDLGFVASKNSNATAMQAYQFIDKESGKTGTRYYRLKQTDLDGTVTYSALKAVTFGKGKMQEIAVYPNPFEQNLTLEVAGKMKQNATVEITDVLGKVVYTSELHLLEGTNNTTINLPVSVTKGLYTLAVKTAEGVSYQKLIKK